jgi:hypothetical protein
MPNDLKSNIQGSVNVLNPIRVRGAKKQGLCLGGFRVAAGGGGQKNVFD